MLLTWHLKLTKLVEISKNSLLYFWCNPKIETTIRKVTQASTKSNPVFNSLLLTILILLLTSLLPSLLPICKDGLEETESMTMLNRTVRSFSIVCLFLAAQAFLAQISCQRAAANYSADAENLSQKMKSFCIQEIAPIEREDTKARNRCYQTDKDKDQNF